MDRTPSGKEKRSWLFWQRLSSHCRAWLDRDPVARAWKLLLCFARSRRFAAESIPVEELSPDALTDVNHRSRAIPFDPSDAPRRAHRRAKCGQRNSDPCPGVPRCIGKTTDRDCGGDQWFDRRQQEGTWSRLCQLSGNTATVQLSIPTDKIPGLPRGYLNGSFNITTDGPTPLSAFEGLQD